MQNRLITWRTYDTLSLGFDLFSSDLASLQEAAMDSTPDGLRQVLRGLGYREDQLWFNPHLSDNLKLIRFRLRYRGRWIKVEVTKTQVRIVCDSGKDTPLPLNVKGQESRLQMGETLVFDLAAEEIKKENTPR